MRNRYTIRILDRSAFHEWDEFVDRSDEGTLFHKSEFLQAAENHSALQLIPITVIKGEDLVCVFPLFVKRKHGLKILLTPPNGSGIPYLGPVISLNKNSKYKYEKAYFALVDEILSFIKDEISYDYLRIVFSPGNDDLRPFLWNGLSIQPFYTYFLDISRGKDVVFNEFDGRIRTSIRKAEKTGGVSHCSGEQNDYFTLLSLVRSRYASQGLKYKITDEYFRELLKGSLKDNIKVISVYSNNKLITGNILLEYKNTVHHWIGGINPAEKATGVNELLHWKIIQDYADRNFKYYEMMGANTRHLCDHKSKYNPEVIAYYAGEKYNMKGRIAKSLFKRVRGNE